MKNNNNLIDSAHHRGLYESHFDHSENLPIHLLYTILKFYDGGHRILNNTPSLPLITGYLITQEEKLLSRWEHQKIPIVIDDTTSDCELSVYENDQRYTCRVTNTILSYLWQPRPATTLTPEPTVLSHSPRLNN